MQIGTPLGLAFASGINAYLPLLSFALSVRLLHLYKANPNFAFVSSNWFIIALIVLAIVDFVADKIPVIDHAWDTTHTIIRPLAGALVAAASSNQVTIPLNTSSISSSISGTASIAAVDLHIAGVGLLVIAIIGGLLAAISHAAKSTTRLVSTITTVGLFNIILSISEDILVVIAILLSLFVPTIMLVVIVVSLLLLGPSVFAIWNNWLSSRSRL